MDAEKTMHGAFDDLVLDPEQLRFSRSARGGLVLRLDGEEHESVNLRLAFPLEAEEEFIGIFLSDGSELGMLPRLGDLEPASQEVLREELRKIYFRPRVVTIGKIVEEHGVLRGEIETTSGPRPLEIRGWRQNVRILSDNRAIIQDVDGNRYLVDDWRELPKLTRDILGL